MPAKRPAIVKELRDGLVTPGATPGSRVAGQRAAGAWEKVTSGRWRRPYQLATYVLSVGAAAAVLGFGTSELDDAGREHCFTWAFRLAREKRDAWLGVETPAPRPTPRPYE